MTTTIIIIGFAIIMAVLFLLQDTITEALSGGKSFMPCEMKSSSKPQPILLLKAYSKRKPLKTGFSADTLIKRSILTKEEKQSLFDTFLLLIALLGIFKMSMMLFESLNL